MEKMIAGLGFSPAVGVTACNRKRTAQATQPKNPTSVSIDPRVEGDLSACNFLRKLFFRLSKEFPFSFIGSDVTAIRCAIFSLQRFIHFFPGVQKLRVE